MQFIDLQPLAHVSCLPFLSTVQQQPNYPDQEVLKTAHAEIARMPPLVGNGCVCAA